VLVDVVEVGPPLPEPPPGPFPDLSTITGVLVAVGEPGPPLPEPPPGPFPPWPAELVTVEGGEEPGPLRGSLPKAKPVAEPTASKPMRKDEVNFMFGVKL
jgi:hypothetical protein